ncbi:MAG: hypothetical protein P857_882 [Candidatus Xenolissoclinum pacificiensis L6]|uniref:CagE TrbE VirB component of type IV transporter system central domain-containing protein n=1 Tax=Candidatus Xenolissoclinum pacificiensis L6 TaxID=1401685 RepID=W2V0V5_9RICK|nr:MAG: hypothetical protein P857_882 [Candidatus Xenolissoclinum pacificiensis L6]
MPDINDNVTNLEFLDENKIPYACYLNKHTIITKKGNLLQIIKISSYNSDDCIRQKLIDILKKTDQHNFSFWTHIIRYKNKLKHKHEHYFANQLFDSYRSSNDLEQYYTNDLYISIVTKHNTFQDITTLFQKASSEKTIYKEYKTFFENHLKKLDDFREEIVQQCKNHRPKLVAIDENFNSELLATLKRIILLKKTKPLTIQIKDIAQNLSKTCKVIPNFNYIKHIHQNSEFFTSILNVKHFRAPTSYETIDHHLINIPQSFMISEIIVPIHNRNVNKYFKEQVSILSETNDSDTNKILGFENIINDLKKNRFFSHNLHITLSADSVEELNNNITEIYDKLRQYGLHVIRNDLKTERVFFSLLPGNFNYIQDPKINHLDNIFSCCNLCNYPSGFLKNAIWKSPITVFKNFHYKPYFFCWNYVENLQNSLFISNKRHDSNIVKNFLLAMSISKDISIMILENLNLSEIFTCALEAKYYNFDTQDLSINILENNSINDREFMTQIVMRLSNFKIEKEELETVLEQIVGNKDLDSVFDSLIGIPSILQNVGDVENFKKITNNSFNLDDKILGIKLPTLSEENMWFKSILVYYLLIRRIKTRTNAAYNLISIEGMEFFRYFTSTQIEYIVNLARKNRYFLLFNFSESFFKINNSYINGIVNSCESIFVFSGEKIFSKEWAKKISLTKKDLDLILDLDSLDFCFFLMQKSVGSSIIRFDYSKMLESFVLTTYKKTLTIKNDIQKKNLQDWLPVFYKNLTTQKK